MKNWTLFALGTLAAGSMMISSAACTVSSSSGSGAGGSSSGGGFDCNALCAQADGAKCSGDKAGDCATSCAKAQSEATAKGCSTQLNAYGTCVSGQTFVCDKDMKAGITGCDTELKALGTCVTATGGMGGMGGAGGSGNPGDTTILGAFEDPSAPACHDCLKGMMGQLTLVDGSMVDCGGVTAACGAKDEKCMSEVVCIDAYVKAHPMDKLDCAVDKCIMTQPEANNFFNCAADRCGSQCTLTKGFTTTNCGMLFAHRELEEGAPGDISPRPFLVLCAPFRARRCRSSPFVAKLAGCRFVCSAFPST